MSKLLLGENSQAMNKIDSLVREEEPYRNEPGGTSYVSRNNYEQSVVKMYERDTDNKKLTKADIVKIVALSIFAIAVILAIIFYVLI